VNEQAAEAMTGILAALSSSHIGDERKKPMRATTSAR